MMSSIPYLYLNPIGDGRWWLAWVSAIGLALRPLTGALFVADVGCRPQAVNQVSLVDPPPDLAPALVTLQPLTSAIARTAHDRIQSQGRNGRGSARVP
jgi:hypothetical protein